MSDIKKRGDAARQLIMAKDEEIHRLKSKLAGPQASSIDSAAPAAGSLSSPTKIQRPVGPTIEGNAKDNSNESTVSEHLDTNLSTGTNTNETKDTQRKISPPVMSTPVCSDIGSYFNTRSEL